MNELKERLETLVKAYMICPQSAKRTILNEMLKVKKQINKREEKNE